MIAPTTAMFIGLLSIVIPAILVAVRPYGRTNPHFDGNHRG